MWFKYVLFVFFIIEAMFYLARTGGWEPKKAGAGACFLIAIFNALIAAGIWFWL